MKIRLMKFIIVLQKQFKYLKTTHLYYLVDSNPWLLLTAVGTFMLTLSAVLYIHLHAYNFTENAIEFLMLIFIYTYFNKRYSIMIMLSAIAAAFSTTGILIILVTSFMIKEKTLQNLVIFHLWFFLFFFIL
jgi:hypothetical protein